MKLLLAIIAMLPFAAKADIILTPITDGNSPEALERIFNHGRVQPLVGVFGPAVTSQDVYIWGPYALGPEHTGVTSDLPGNPPTNSGTFAWDFPNTPNNLFFPRVTAVAIYGGTDNFIFQLFDVTGTNRFKGEVHFTLPGNSPINQAYLFGHITLPDTGTTAALLLLALTTLLFSRRLAQLVHSRRQQRN
jgi:hypothetical protein